MKKTLFTLLTIIIGFAYVNAAEPTTDGYIVFTYGEGWSEFSKTKAKEMLNCPLLQSVKTEKNLTYKVYPRLEKPTASQKIRLEEIKGNLQIPNPRSYPALLLLDQDGKHMTTLCGTDLLPLTAEERADLVKLRFEQIAQRRTLLQEAAALGNVPAKAIKLDEAVRLTTFANIYGVENLLNQIKAADSGNTTRLITKYEFNGASKGEAIMKLPLDTAITEAKEILDDPIYASDDKLLVCAAILGHLRRNATSNDHAKAVTEIAKQMKEIAQLPDSGHPGSGTPGGISFYMLADNILSSWGPPEAFATYNWDGLFNRYTSEADITDYAAIDTISPGTYTITFNWRSGIPLNIKSVALYDDYGSKLVVKDEHVGVASANPKNNVYILNVPRHVEYPTFMVVPNGPHYSNSGGDIYFIKN